MNSNLLPLILIGVFFLALIALNEKLNLFRSDRFTPATKYLAYGWLGFFLLGMAYLITTSAHRQPTMEELRHTPFYALFALHYILIVFLAGWWLLAGRPPIGEFLNIRRERSGEMIMTGIAAGVGGWAITIIMAILLGAILTAMHFLPKQTAPPAQIVWLAGVSFWKKATLVLAAMTVEEAFFRGWLQKRVGLIVSTILFALAHSGYGQPLLLIGVGIISLIIGFVFYRTRNLIPGVIAHGVFDAIQLFVIAPIVFRMIGTG